MWDDLVFCTSEGNDSVARIGSSPNDEIATIKETLDRTRKLMKDYPNGTTQHRAHKLKIRMKERLLRKQVEDHEALHSDKDFWL